MRIFSDLDDPRIASLLRQGAVGVIPTDTLYGLVASVQSKKAVERVYALRHRNLHKPCIVLVGRPSDIADKAAWTSGDYAVTQRFWPGRVSIVLPATKVTPEYIHRGTMSVAYRFPDEPELQRLLQQTGPLIAPSANLEGRQPAATMAEAQAYFGDNVDFYVDADELQSEPSTLIKTDEDGALIVLRLGAVTIDN